MIILVLGTPKSGKSLMAEELSLALNDSEKYYLATMRVMDQEGALRVEKHRKQRAGQGFREGNVRKRIIHEAAIAFR